MNVFLLFAFNAECLRDHLREPWMEVYDYVYLDEKIIGGVERNLSKVADILQAVEKRATGKISTSANLSRSGVETSGENSTLGMSGVKSAPEIMDEEVPKKKPTGFEPFNLTKPKPKMIPMPEAIKREVKANPVDKRIYKKSLADIEAEKLARRLATVQAVQKEYEQSEKKPFVLTT